MATDRLINHTQGNQIIEKLNIIAGNVSYPQLVAPIETTSTASMAHAVGTYFVYNGYLYRTTVAISQGGTITPNTNCVTTNVGSEFTSVKDTLGNPSSASSVSGNDAFSKIANMHTSIKSLEDFREKRGKLAGVFNWNTSDTFTRNNIPMSEGPRLLYGGRGGSPANGFVVILANQSNEYIVVSDPNNVINSISWTISNNLGSLSIKFAKTYGSSMTYGLV